MEDTNFIILSIPISIRSNFSEVSQGNHCIADITKKCFVGFVTKGYHVYQGIWVPKIGEILSTEREPGNPKDKYAVCVKKNECIVGHLPFGKTGKKYILLFKRRKIQHM